MKFCRHGHQVEGANVYRDPSGREQCRTCRTAQQRRRRADAERAAATSAELDAAQVRRLREAWTDSEATRDELAGRFGIGPDQVKALTAGLRRGAA